MSNSVSQSVRTHHPIGRYDLHERSGWPSKECIIIGLLCILLFIYGGIYVTLSQYGLEEYANPSFAVVLLVVILAYSKFNPVNRE
jgi:hypothetical protein